MRTLVELRISQKVNSKIIKEVISLTRVNTPKPKEIVVKEDAIDDRLLLVTFESYKGKQIDLVDGIARAYTHHMESYSDITIFFETRNKIGSIEDRLAITSKKEVVKLVENYFKSIDEKDWILMSECLNERIELKPKPPIRSSINGVKRSVYLDHMEKIISKMEINHEIDNCVTRRDGYKIRCNCQLKINGGIKETNKSFIASGEFEFGIKRANENKLEATIIKRNIKEIEGNRKLFEKYMN